MALADSLLAYWKLDEASGTREDATASNVDLSDSGSTPSAAGKINSAADFDGSTQYLSTTSATLDAIAGSFSVQAWMYFDSVSGQRYFGRGVLSSGTNFTFLMGLDGNPFFQFHGSGGAVSAGGAFTVNTGTWYHFVGVLDTAADTLTLYVNTTQVGQTSTADSPSYSGTQRLSLGRDNFDASKLDGRMDEVGIWTRALSPSEVSQLYNSGSGLAYPFAATVARSVSVSTGYAASRTVSFSRAKVLARSVSASMGYAASRAVSFAHAAVGLWTSVSSHAASWTGRSESSTMWTST